MTRAPKCSPEVQKRAVRTVLEHAAPHDSQWAAIECFCHKQTLIAATLNPAYLSVSGSSMTNCYPNIVLRSWILGIFWRNLMGMYLRKYFCQLCLAQRGGDAGH